MTSNGPFAHAQIHHIALRVVNAKASKDWFLTKLDFRVAREFSFGGMDFVWLSPTEGNASVIELIGGGIGASRPPYQNAQESLKQPGFHHICLHVNDIEQVMSEIRHRDVKILIDVMAGAPGSGVEKRCLYCRSVGQYLRTVRTCADSEDRVTGR